MKTRKIVEGLQQISDRFQHSMIETPGLPRKECDVAAAAIEKIMMLKKEVGSLRKENKKLEKKCKNLRKALKFANEQLSDPRAYP